MYSAVVMDCTLDMRRGDVCWVRRMEDSRVCESECDDTVDSVWNDVDDDGVVDEEEKKE